MLGIYFIFLCSLGPVLPQCVPQTKIAFLKTHKCASSTIQNILFRFGEARQLNFVFPSRGNYLGRNEHFDRNMISTVPWKNLEYDIFAVHTMWNTSEIQSVLGAAQKPTLISILRDPVDLFESLYSFAQWDKLFNMNIEKFANAVFINVSGADFSSIGGYTGHNQMLHDFGLPEANSTNKAMVKAKILEIERDFDFIMIAENLDESLIMLRYGLCWPIHDITHLSINERQSHYRRKLNDTTRTLLRQWLWADQMLYDHFLQVFRRKRSEFGVRRLSLEKIKLQKMNDYIKKYCGVKESSFKNLKGDFKPSNLRVKGFKVNEKEECKAFARSELAYIDILRNDQVIRSTSKQNQHPATERQLKMNLFYNDNGNFSEHKGATEFWKKSYGIHVGETGVIVDAG